MSEIEAGEYIRTNTGIISKLEYIEVESNEKYYWFEKTIYYSYEDAIDFLKEEEIEKHIKAHSKNIIDLIEVGDIVGVTFWHEPDSFEKFVYDVKDLNEFKEQIKEQIITIDTILTHEQFERNSYKVGEIE